MVHEIFAHYTASIADLKEEPKAVVNAAHGEVLAVLDNNEPVFYCLPPVLFEKILDRLDDLKLIELVEARKNDETFEVKVDDI